MDGNSKTLPASFLFAGRTCGIKPSGLPDLALIAAEKPMVAVGVYTQNLVRAACIDWNRGITPTPCARAILINSGNANACTGAVGIANNAEMAELTAQSLGRRFQDAVKPQQVLVLSTGVIGQKLPMDCLRTGISAVVESSSADPMSFDAASRAILTTDHGPKVIFRSWSARDHSYSLAAMCKGAGMIGPNMATMLGIICTDHPLSVPEAQHALQVAVSQSFNRISVEGHTSTNDAVILLCPEADSAIRPSVNESHHSRFQSELNAACLELAKRIPTDGEGARHLIHIRVSGAESSADADRIARAIALSNLVKTAIAGGDPNWGRIVSAAGYSGARFDVESLNLKLNGIDVFRSGQPTDFDRKQTSQSLRDRPVAEIDLSVGTGPGATDHWTSDLTVEYVKLNAEYTT